MSAPKLVIATPTRGTVAIGYHVRVRELERGGAVVIPHELHSGCDIVRARSRCVRYAISKGFEWLLFWDDDVVPVNADIVPRMIARAAADGHMWMGAPYPKHKDPPTYPYRPVASEAASGQLQIVRDCVEVEGLAIGFTLIHRDCLTAMVKEYEHTEWFTDEHESGVQAETVGIFNLLLTPEVTLSDGRRFRELLSEDYAGCYRWRAMGGKVQMFVGEGVPLKHVGLHAFRGAREDLGRVR